MACSMLVKSTNAKLTKHSCQTSQRRRLSAKNLPLTQSTVLKRPHTNFSYPYVLFLLFLLLLLFIFYFRLLLGLELSMCCEEVAYRRFGGFKAEISQEQSGSWGLFLCTEDFLGHFRHSLARKGYGTVICYVSCISCRCRTTREVAT